MYVPILKWKLGEYQALFRLENETKNHVFPFIEIPPIGWDFDKQQLAKSIDEHLEGFGKKLNDKWGNRGSFVDLKLLDENDRMHDGTHPVNYIFGQIRKNNASGIPVTQLNRDAHHQDAIKKVINLDKKGVCLRLTIDDLAKGDMDYHITTLTKYLNTNIENVDLLLDLAAPNFQPITSFVNAIYSTLRNIHLLPKCRTFTIAATSFPESMGNMNKGENIVDRLEWLFFTDYKSKVTSNDRMPQFGDYAIAHPEIVNLDMRFVRPSASLRYTIDDKWYIYKGTNVRDYGFKQYKDICSALLSSGYFLDKDFSKADLYINECSNGTGSTGNLSVWRWVGTNHHITKVVFDLANSDAL